MKKGKKGEKKRGREGGLKTGQEKNKKLKLQYELSNCQQGMGYDFSTFLNKEKIFSYSRTSESEK